MPSAIYTGDLSITAFDCGCVWRWWVKYPLPDQRNHSWEKQCRIHAAQSRPAECTCLIIGQDDGATTCWPHHDCMKGDCTHGE